MDLRVGDEVDYNPIDGFWVPARVEALEDGPVALLRFRAGAACVSHRVDVAVAAERLRIASAGVCWVLAAGPSLC